LSVVEKTGSSVKDDFSKWKSLEPFIIVGRELIYMRSQLCRVKGEEMPRDPVCGMILDEKTSRFKIKYEGETYHFCSVKCKKKFKRNPRKFAE